MPTIRVVIASDNSIIRTALAALLDRIDDFEVSASIRLSTLTTLSRRSSDVLLLEIPESQVGRLRRITTCRHAARVRAVVLLDSNPNAAYIRSVFAVGAKAYVLKSSDVHELYKAIRLAYRGRTYLDSELGMPIADDLLNGQRYVSGTGVRHLSRREAQVIREVARGFTSKAIARKLGVSQKTIQTYRARIYEKLELGTRAEIVQYALRNGLLPGMMPASDDADLRGPGSRVRKNVSLKSPSERRCA